VIGRRLRVDDALPGEGHAKGRTLSAGQSIGLFVVKMLMYKQSGVDKRFEGLTDVVRWCADLRCRIVDPSRAPERTGPADVAKDRRLEGRKLLHPPILPDPEPSSCTHGGAPTCR